MLSDRLWRRGRRGRPARPVVGALLCAFAVIAAGGAMRLAPTDNADSPATLPPLIAMDPVPELPAPDTPGPSAAAVEPDEADGEAAPELDRHPEPAATAVAEPDIPLAGQTLPTDELPTFDGRPIRPVQTITMIVTAYSPDAASCAPYDDGITASGYSVYTNAGRLVAADTDLLPFGTILSIPGYHDGQPVPVLDRGGAIKGKRLDVLYPTHNRALQWGVQTLDVTVWQYADESPT